METGPSRLQPLLDDKEKRVKAAGNVDLEFIPVAFTSALHAARLSNLE